MRFFGLRSGAETVVRVVSSQTLTTGVSRQNKQHLPGSDIFGTPIPPSVGDSSIGCRIGFPETQVESLGNGVPLFGPGD